MWKAALAAVVAFMAIGTTSLSADPAQSQISQVKSALQLTPAQERYWPPVEAALRGLVRQATASYENNDGYYQRAKKQVYGVASNAAAVRRVVAAARPLIRVLDESQKQTARSLASSFGGASFASAL